MSGAKPLLLYNAFMASTRTTFFYFTITPCNRCGYVSLLTATIFKVTLKEFMLCVWKVFPNDVPTNKTFRRNIKHMSLLHNILCTVLVSTEEYIQMHSKWCINLRTDMIIYAWIYVRMRIKCFCVCWTSFLMFRKVCRPSNRCCRS